MPCWVQGPKLPGGLAWVSYCPAWHQCQLATSLLSEGDVHAVQDVVSPSSHRLNTCSGMQVDSWVLVWTTHSRFDAYLLFVPALCHGMRSHSALGAHCPLRLSCPPRTSAAPWLPRKRPWFVGCYLGISHVIVFEGIGGLCWSCTCAGKQHLLRNMCSNWQDLCFLPASRSRS